MKKIFALILALLLTVPAAATVGDSALPIRFNESEGIYTIWAEYTSTAESLNVAFPVSYSQGYQAISNYKDGTLMVAIVSAAPLDLSQPVAYVTEPGRGRLPSLELTALRFNEEPVDESGVYQYTVTFTDEDGTVLKEPTAYDYGTAANQIEKPADPVKAATAEYTYTFAGWSPAITDVTEAVTYKAIYSAKKNRYTITFDTVGGSVVAPIKQDYSTAVTAPDDPTKEGYTFDGWDKDIPSTMPAEDVTITAKWKVNQYTITFDTQGGSAIDPIKQDYGTAVTAPADPKKKGYSFDGWDKDIPSTMPAENLTITAIWKKAEIVFREISVDGDSEAASIPGHDFTVQTKITVPETYAPEKIQVLMASYDSEGRFLSMEKAELIKLDLADMYNAKADIKNDGSVAKVSIFVLDINNWIPLADCQEILK